MRKGFGIVFMILGTALVLGALLLFAYNQRENRQAETASQQMLEQIQNEIKNEIQKNASAETQILADNTPVELLRPEDLIMTEKVINGYPCIGYVSIPELMLQLPVITDWNGRKLQTAPCRFSGTLKGKDLVIMAHSYKAHFGRLSDLSEGSEIQFTDMDGNLWYYEVVLMDILEPTDVDEMIAGEYDLTLFSCTPTGKQRVTVRCNMLEK